MAGRLGADGWFIISDAIAVVVNAVAKLGRPWKNLCVTVVTVLLLGAVLTHTDTISVEVQAA